MALNLPTSSKIVKDRLKTDISIRLALSNPFLKGSWLRAFAESLGERMYDFYYAITRAIEQIFPDTTTDNLDRWGSFYNISRLSATKSTGYITFQGTGSPATIPLGHKFVDTDGNIFVSTQAKDTAISITLQNTLTQTAGVATFTGATANGYNNGDTVTIASAADALYNVTEIITTVSDTVFTYAVDSTASSSTTGGTVGGLTGFLTIESEIEGAVMNLPHLTVLNLQTPITNIDDTVGIWVGDLAGGSDQEGDEPFRDRLLDIIRNPVAHFNISDIERVSKAVSMVTRVFVKETTPADGQVTIYPMVDNETNPIPGAATTTAVKNAILAIKPANTSDDDVIVTAPTAVATAYTFSALSPNTADMRTAIEENLKQFYATKVDQGTAIEEDAYRSAIFQTIDIISGDSIISFALSAPSGQIAITSVQIGTLGALTWP